MNCTTTNRNEKQAVRSADLPEIVVVFGLWAAMTFIGIIFIVKCGCQLPIKEDTIHLTYIANGGPLSWGWLLERVGEARMPFSRLLMWLSWHITGGELRAAMLCSFISLASAALTILLMIRHLRRTTDIVDIVVPLSMLNLGHAENMLWFMMAHVSWNVCIVSLVIVLFAKPEWLQRRSGVIVLGIALIFLCLNEPRGVAYAFPLAFALPAVAVWCYPERRKGKWNVSTLAIVFLFIFVLAVAIQAWSGGSGVNEPLALLRRGGAAGEEPLSITASSIGARAKTTLQLLSVTVGVWGRRMWPASGWLMAGLIGTTLITLLSQFRSCRSRSPREIYLLLLSGTSVVGVAVIIGCFRTTEGALWDRYAIYGVPIIIWIHICWRNGGEQSVGRVVSYALMFLMCATAVENYCTGRAVGKTIRLRQHEFAKDAQAGIPLLGLTARHARKWHWDQALWREAIEGMSRGGGLNLGVVRPDPDMKTVHLAAEPDSVHELISHDGVWIGNGSQSSVEYILDEAAWVYAVELRFRMRTKSQKTVFVTTWERFAETTVTKTPARDEALILLGGEAALEKTVWIDDRIRRISISPSADLFEMEVLAIALIVPMEEDRIASESR